jgi:hypothetical protein
LPITLPGRSAPNQRPTGLCTRARYQAPDHAGAAAIRPRTITGRGLTVAEVGHVDDFAVRDAFDDFPTAADRDTADPSYRASTDGRIAAGVLRLHIQGPDHDARWLKHQNALKVAKASAGGSPIMTDSRR